MSAQRLNAKSIRRIERTIGEPVKMAWSHGGYWMSFVTPDHRHGEWRRWSGEWHWDNDPMAHYTTCREWWPDDFEGD